MKQIIASLVVIASAMSYCMAQLGEPATNGLTPRTATFYVNTNWNNNGLNSLGVDITSNSNVVVGFEDDATPSSSMFHWAAVWTLCDRDGNLLTPEGTLTSINPLMQDHPTGTNIVTTYRAFYRNDGTPIPGRTGWGPKVKANRYGGGFGMIAVSYDMHSPGSASGTNGIGNEIAHLFDTGWDDSMNAGGDLIGAGFPALQLMNNDSTPVGPVLAGGTGADYQPAGAVRNADWDYLANGNIVIVGESRQVADRALTGQAGGNVPTYTVVTPAGAIVKAYSAVSSGDLASDMWHGVGVTANGFAVRWGHGGLATMRLFDNSGNPTSDNIDIGTVAGIPALSAGGRGDGTGFHGNGTDAYVYACNGGSPATAHVAVFNANGTLRWARRVADEDNTPNSDRMDAAIAPDGRVVVIFDASNQEPSGVRMVMGRMFDRFGEPLGDIFYVSENENPPIVGEGRRARVAWRDGMVAVVWESRAGASNIQSTHTTGVRLFDTAAYTPVAPGPMLISLPTPNGEDLPLVWSGGSPPFRVQKRDTIDGTWGDVATGLSYRNYTHVGGFSGGEGYYQIVGN